MMLELAGILNYSNAALVGASAGIFGVLIAASQVAPNTTVLIYGVIPARLRTVAWVLLAVAVYTRLPKRPQRRRRSRPPRRGGRGLSADS